MFCREFTELSGRKLGFVGGSIKEKSSWIKISPQTDIERLKTWLLCELDSMMDKIKLQIKDTILMTTLFISKQLSKYILS